MTDIASYKWAQSRSGFSYVAIVTLDVVQNDLNKNEIVEYYSGKGFTSQGHFEDVPASGYDSWKIAARNGLTYGFSLTEKFWTVHIYKIEGLTTDTNPSTAGYTILRAFCQKIGLKLDAQQIKELEDFVFSSWAKPYRELIPDFRSLSFTEFKK